MVASGPHQLGPEGPATSSWSGHAVAVVAATGVVYIGRDATAKYGRRATECQLAGTRLTPEHDPVDLHIDDYPGGVALWGAVPPVYDTTLLPVDRGIHVHARNKTTGRKEIDKTVGTLRVLGDDLPEEGFVVTELDGIYYMVTSIFGHEPTAVTCTHCGRHHLDRDWFSVHPHRRHLCIECGMYFNESAVGIGNPIEVLRAILKAEQKPPQPAARTIEIQQADYEGGIQVWGSNPAFLWTSRAPEEEGIHIHAFRSGDQEEPDPDETYSEVVIDGIRLDAELVRVSMAQSALPHLRGRFRAMKCPSCGRPQFDTGEAAYTPRIGPHM